MFDDIPLARMPPLTRATPKGVIRRRLYTAWQVYMSACWAAVCMRTGAVSSHARTDVYIGASTAATSIPQILPETIRPEPIVMCYKCTDYSVRLCVLDRRMYPSWGECERSRSTRSARPPRIQKPWTHMHAISARDVPDQVIILQHLGPRGVPLCGSNCA